MGLETGSTISSFITSNPTSSDPVNQGDDHLRLIKSVLKAQFPGSAGSGFAIPITATEAEINALHGLTNFYFASGTRMPFAQAAAPTGWTQDITDNANNRMLRVVNSAGGGVGGTDSPIVNSTTMVAHTHTFTGAAHTHTDSGHSHTLTASTGAAGGAYVNITNGFTSYMPNSNQTSSVISSESANISTTTAGGSNSSTTGVSWTPRYIDMIICTKN